jgi:hypothetical protein
MHARTTDAPEGTPLRSSTILCDENCAFLVKLPAAGSRLNSWNNVPIGRRNSLLPMASVFHPKGSACRGKDEAGF